jgi:hypothetical protein
MRFHLCVCPLRYSTSRRMMFERGARLKGANTLRDVHLGTIRASEARFLLRTQHPVERLVRDGVLSEKEAQLRRVFLHMAQGVQ